MIALPSLKLKMNHLSIFCRSSPSKSMCVPVFDSLEKHAISSNNGNGKYTIISKNCELKSDKPRKQLPHANNWNYYWNNLLGCQETVA